MGIGGQAQPGQQPQNPAMGNGKHPVHNITVHINSHSGGQPVPPPQGGSPQTNTPAVPMGQAVPYQDATAGDPTAQPNSAPGMAMQNQQQGQGQGSGATLPKRPPKEPAPTAETQVARKRQSQVLKARQSRETQGRMRGAPRDVDAGAGGFWPPLSPLL